jgi:formylglycine-generating enzyme required for sulfatase activity
MSGEPLERTLFAMDATEILEKIEDLADECKEPVVAQAQVKTPTPSALVPSTDALTIETPASSGKQLEPVMVSIPAGTFTMGCQDGRDNVDGVDKCDNTQQDETPTHEVTLDAFQLGKYEVTFDEWDLCLKDGACPTIDNQDEGWGRGKLPVINVSWDDAQTYIAWLNKRTGKKYRLPTEAEWEYASRAGHNTAYSWGYAIGKGNANCDNAQCGDQFEHTAPVDSFTANAYGLHNMHGNVWEWCQDWYGDSSYSSSSASNPKGAESGVLRGGSWDYDARLVRSASRFLNTPGAPNRCYGFRLAHP